MFVAPLKHKHINTIFSLIEIINKKIKFFLSYFSFLVICVCLFLVGLLLDEMFSLATKEAKAKMLCYVSSNFVSKYLN